MYVLLLLSIFCKIVVCCCDFEKKKRKNIFPKVRGILDGTYIYVQKSTDLGMQKLTYSGHKKRNLFKFMFLVLPDGKIWDCFEPMGGDGTHNDQHMLSYIISQNIGNFASVFDPS